LQTNLGWPLNSGVTTNINLRTDHFNIFNTTGIRYSDAPGRAYFKNLYFSDTRDNPLLIEDRDYNRLRKGINTNLGIEYFLSDESSITAVGFFRTGDNETTTTNITNEFNRSNDLAVIRERVESEK